MLGVAAKTGYTGASVCPMIRFRALVAAFVVAAGFAAPAFAAPAFAAPIAPPVIDPATLLPYTAHGGSSIHGYVSVQLASMGPVSVFCAPAIPYVIWYVGGVYRNEQQRLDSRIAPFTQEPAIGPDRSFACENLAPGQYAVWAVTRPPAKHGFGAIGVGLAKDKTVNIVL